MGDFDGDGTAGIAVGLGTGSSALIQVFDDAAHGFAPMTEVSHGWVRSSGRASTPPTATAISRPATSTETAGPSSWWAGTAAAAGCRSTTRRRVRPAIGPAGSLDPNAPGTATTPATAPPIRAAPTSTATVGPTSCWPRGDGGYGWTQIFEKPSSGFVLMANTPKGGLDSRCTHIRPLGPGRDLAGTRSLKARDGFFDRAQRLRSKRPHKKSATPPRGSRLLAPRERSACAPGPVPSPPPSRLRRVHPVCVDSGSTGRGVFLGLL